MSDPKKSSPFGALASLKDALPAGPAAKAQPAAASKKPDPFAGKVVVAKSRKGRGGKTVTTVTGIAGELDELARELKHALGCGAVVEDRAIVVQGEQEERVKAFLEKRGARRVILGT